ncbi:DUF2264 domain-containing protein [Aureibacillus halotolerans]|uniref:DUF2264 domain-containing protein n=1 Tax=Aureibacillus halotolerans TaxID=1508390 RepID=A0A4R6U6N9_9BACI|nr:DUF2264 domain-containing protein [Aureibacillus halotolerans]TDQ42170.1 hypothetical protein EV213_102201 [Aureibacillus halotolerans]
MNDRTFWLNTMQQMATPVLTALSAGELKAKMPIETSGQDRGKYTHLEAVGRLLAGMAPWLETPHKGEEEQLRVRCLKDWREGIDAITSPDHPDYVNFTEGLQPIVDTAFLAQAVLRAPTLFSDLPPRTRKQLADAFISTRDRKPVASNWLLFAACTEAAISVLGETWDPMRVDYALRQHEQWYLGDGYYGDGPKLHMDYYNSFVILPMLYDILHAVPLIDGTWKTMKVDVQKRLGRHAELQERMISPEGTYPAVGRSLAYRFGCLQALAMAVLHKELPPHLSEGQVRAAMTAVLKRQMHANRTYDADGWLTIGFVGHQPSIGEGYISTGSLYLASVGLLPLGLSADDAFWTTTEKRWTSVKVWNGDDFACDHALD